MCREGGAETLRSKARGAARSRGRQPPDSPCALMAVSGGPVDAIGPGPCLLLVTNNQREGSLVAGIEWPDTGEQYGARLGTIWPHSMHSRYYNLFKTGSPSFLLSRKIGVFCKAALFYDEAWSRVKFFFYNSSQRCELFSEIKYRNYRR